MDFFLGWNDYASAVVVGVCRQNSLPGEVVDAPSWLVFKRHLDNVLSNLL